MSTDTRHSPSTRLIDFEEAMTRLDVTREVLTQWTEMGLVHVTEEGRLLDSDVENVLRERESARIRHPSSR